MKRKIFKRRKRKGKRRDGRIKKDKSLTLISLTMFALVLVTGGYLFYRSHYNKLLEQYNMYEPVFAPGDTERLSRDLSTDRSFDLLVLGLDQGENGHIKTDAAFMVHYDSISKEFQFFSLPTKADYYWPERGAYYELSDIYALGQLETPEAGYSMLSEVVEHNVAIRFDGYVAADIVAFSELVGSLGTLSVQNEQSFSDKDLEVEGERATFPEGFIDLSGNDLVSYVRADEGGFVVKEVRHTSVAKILLQNIGPDTLYEVVGNIDDHFYSNLTGDTLRYFVKLFSKDHEYGINAYNIAGVLTRKGNHEIFDMHKFDDFVAATFENGEVVREQARVEVYNTTSIPGLASKYTRILNNLGCDVIRKSNADIDVASTIIFSENPDKYQLTIDQIRKAFPVEVDVIRDTPNFVTTGDLIVVLSEDVESI